MAVSNSDIKFPGPVIFNDDDPKEGFARVILVIKEMKVEKKFGGKPKAKNAEIKTSFADGAVLVDVVVDIEDSKKVHYNYKKNLPEDVKEADCKYELRNVDGQSQIHVKLAKAKKESWAAHARHFTQAVA